MNATLQSTEISAALVHLSLCRVRPQELVWLDTTPHGANSRAKTR
jgi:hypothetical protein